MKIRLFKIVVLSAILPSFLSACDSNNQAHTHTSGKPVEENIVEATCLEDGHYDLVTYCIEDNEEISRKHMTIPALGHNLVHHDGKEATCTEDGYAPYDTCSRCDYSTYQVIEKTGHQHLSTREENRVEPTCTEPGSYDLVTYCTDDNVVINRENKTIPALEHDLIHHDGKPATCTEDGYAPYDTCSRCDYTTYQVIEKTGHQHTATKEENRIEATCTTDGSYDLVTYCTDDNVELSREHKVIPSLGHDFLEEWTIDIEPTCQKTGEKSHHCSRCDEKADVTVVDVCDHKYEFKGFNRNLNVKISPMAVFRCAFCDKSVSYEGTVTSEITKEPTCTVPGIRTYTYTYDKYVETDEEIVDCHVYGEDDHCTICGEILSTAGLKFELNNDKLGYTVVKYEGSNPDIEIMPTHNGLPVTTIGNGQLGINIEANIIRSVVIPDSVTTISSYAFSTCTNLLKVTIGKNVNEIRTGAFLHCEKLAEVYNRSPLKIDEGETSDYGSIKAHVRVIHSNPDYVSKIHSDSDQCYTYVEGDEVTLLGYWGNKSRLKIPDNITAISKLAFSGRKNIISVEIPSSVKSIGTNAFSTCEKLIEIYNLSTLNIEIGSIENGYVAYYAKAVHTDKNEPSIIKEDDNFLYYIKDEKNVLLDYIGNEKAITIKNNIDEISPYCFSFNNVIEEVILPDNITSIPINAFYYSWKLKKITIPVTINKIYANMFYGSNNITDIVLLGESSWRLGNSSTVFSSEELSDSSKVAFYIIKRYTSSGLNRIILDS